MLELMLTLEVILELELDRVISNGLFLRILSRVQYL